MDTSHAVPMLQSLKVKFAIFIALLVVGIIAGNWVAFRHARSLFFQDLEQRGIWGARNLAHTTWSHLANQEIQDLKTQATAMLLQDDVIYIGIGGKDGTLLISSGSLEENRASILPELPHHSCDSVQPLLNYAMMFEEHILLISVPILPLSYVDEANITTIAMPCAGTLHVGIALKTIDQRLFQMLLVLILLCGGIIAVGFVGYRLTSRQVIQPLSHMIEIAQGFAQGDFSKKPLVATTHDEVGVLARILFGFLNQAQQMVLDLKNTSSQISEATEESAHLAQEFATVFDRQSALVYNLSKAVEENTESIDTTTTRSESVASTTEATLESTHKIQQMVRHTMASMEDICGQTDRNSERIGQLGETFSQIGTVVKMITTIADQTRMIAFNASIEAAGAGESGGRFSIVATEVRRLANTVVDSLDEIRELVDSIQSATSELTLSSETGVRKVHQGVAVIRDTGDTADKVEEMLETTADTARNIAHAIQQHQGNLHTILQDIDELTETAEDSASLSTQALDLSRRMQQLADDLHSTLQKIQV